MKKLMMVLAASAMTLTACSTAAKAPEAKASTGEIDYSNQKDWEFVSGKMQSPIDIPTDKTTPMHEKGEIELEYEETVSKVVNNGHSIEGEIEGKAMINGREFELKQFHFHAESEHTFDGKHEPIEIHFVHKAEDGRLAVIGVLVEEGEKNEAFQEVLDAVDKNQPIEHFDASKLLPESRGYYHYLGSLTTPPLTENVEWYVMKDTIQLSKEQIAAFNKYYSDNNRDVQPLDERTILSSID